MNPISGRHQAVFEVVLKLARSGTTVFIADHHLEWIASYADRVIALADGSVFLDSVPGEVLSSPMLLKAGIGWLRYTKAAHLGQERGLWPAALALPVTLSQAVKGFEQAVFNSPSQEQDHADPG